MLTMLTVLTQTPGFSFSGSRSEDYAGWVRAGRRRARAAAIIIPRQVPPEIFEPVRAQLQLRVLDALVAEPPAASVLPLRVK